MAQGIFTPGRIVLVISNLLYAIGAFVFDWNETHVKNPKWPPHARFHNGQTMSLGVMLAATSLYFAFQPAFASSRLHPADAVFYSAAIGSWYCLAGLTAILYPGTDWTDPDIGHGGGQKILFPSIVALMWIGYGLEKGRLRQLEKAKGKKRA